MRKDENEKIKKLKKRLKKWKESSKEWEDFANKLIDENDILMNYIKAQSIVMNNLKYEIKGVYN